MRSAPRVWRGGSKPYRNTATQQPPECQEVTVEVLGVSPGLQRIDIVAPAEPAPQRLQEAQPVPGGETWTSTEEAPVSASPIRRPDPWDRLTR